MITKVKGLVQNYDNGRKKIEVKKEIKLLCGLLHELDFSYIMEHHLSLEKAIESLRINFEKTGQVPVLLSFEKIGNNNVP